jgi:hypothetical protein
MYKHGLQKVSRIFAACVVAVTALSGCSFFSSQSGEVSKTPVPVSQALVRESSFVPIIYPDKVVELDLATGQERTIPDDDLIVENGKVWGRYLRLGSDIRFGKHQEYIMFYNSNLCAPTMTTDIDTIGDSSRPVRSFAIPEKKYDDCEAEEMGKAVDRINKNQKEL